MYPYDDKFDWFAPDVIPVGSLMEATLRWAIATENLSWAFETHCYHESYFIKIMTSHMEENGITLPLLFFDILRDQMLNYHKLSKNSHDKLPNDEQAIQIYKKCYRQACGNNFMNGDILDKFEATLRKTLDERVSKYNNNNTTHQLTSRSLK